MMLTFVLNRLACCKAEKCGLSGLQLLGRVEDIFGYIPSGKRMNLMPQLAFNSFALYLVRDNVASNTKLQFSLMLNTGYA